MLCVCVCELKYLDMREMSDVCCQLLYFTTPGSLSVLKISPSQPLKQSKHYAMPYVCYFIQLPISTMFIQPAPIFPPN